MKRIAYVSVVLAAAIFVLIGCASPEQRAQKLYNAGRYEEVVAKYGDEPKAAAVVQQAKDKIAERWFTEGRFQAVLDTFPSSPSAREARNRLADQLLQQKQYQLIIDKYPDTPAAAQARAELARMDSATNRGAVEQPGSSTGRTGGGGTSASSAKEAAANAELDRIQNIKMKDLRTKALREFANNPQYAGTEAQRKAQRELNK